MKGSARKPKTSRPASTEVVSARFAKPRLSSLRKLYPGRTNQAILESLVEEKLARRDFDSWLVRLKDAQASGDLDLSKV